MLKIKQIRILIVMASILLIAACSETGYEFTPDMAHSRAYEPYSTYGDFESDSMIAREPVKGTVPRGFMPYRFPNSKEGYEQAGNELKNPVPQTAEVLAEGERLYTIYCAICHGEDGEGTGGIVQSGKFPAPPSYFADPLSTLPEGKMYHSIVYGKNLMGSYASQLTPDERWMVIHYVKELQRKHFEGGAANADTTGAAQTVTNTNIDTTASN